MYQIKKEKRQPQLLAAQDVRSEQKDMLHIVCFF